MSQYAHLSTPDPVWAHISEGHSNLDELSVADFPQIRRDRIASRQWLESQRGPMPMKGLKVSDNIIGVQNGLVTVRTYVPQPKEGANERRNPQTYPVLFWIYGGGICTGGFYIDERLLRTLAVEMQISCVTVNFRKAPEHPFPTGLNDAWAALKWAASHTVELRADLTKGFLLGGQTTGSNIIAVMAQRAVKDPVIKGKITGQLLIMPSLIQPKACPEKFKSELLSWEQNKNAPLISFHILEFIYEVYNAPDPSDPEVSPLLTPSLRGLPPTYFQVAGLDCLRDEAFLYERLLRETGIPTKVDVYPGLPHDFFSGFPELEVSRKQGQDLKEGLAWLLHSK